jgi:hypothetical protein
MEESGWQEVPDFSSNVEGRTSMFWRPFDSQDGPPLTAEFLESPLAELAGIGVGDDWSIETMVGNHQYNLRWRKGRLVAILLHEEKQVLMSIVKLAEEPGDTGPEYPGG